MSAPHLTERWRLLRLTAKLGRPGKRGRSMSRLGLRKPARPVDAFLLVPSDLRTPDPGVATEFRQGEVEFAGETVRFGRQSPFRVAGAGPFWQNELQGFGWLRDLAAANDLEMARQLVAEWLEHCSPPDGRAWTPEIVSRRIVSLLSQAGFLLEDAETQFFGAVTSSLALQMQVLAATHRRARPGLPHLQCLLAMLLADLTIADRDEPRESSEKLVLAEIGSQILPDGGHVSRNPRVLLELLLDLLPLRRCYAAREMETPPALDKAMQQMLLHLRTMRLGDGTLGRFNGMGLVRADELSTVLAFDSISSPLPRELPASGYVRFERGQTVMLMDCGSPPPLELAGQAQAGCLSFEMSDGPRAILVNCGYPGSGRSLERPVARATASHNTLSLNGQSSSRFVTSRSIQRLCGDAVLAGPAQVSFRFMEHNGSHAFEAWHDGYAQASQLVHTRRLEVSPDGSRLDGQDRLGPRRGVLRLGRDLPFAIHFHLAPGIGAAMDSLAGNRFVTLNVADGPGWRLSAAGADIEIAASHRYGTTAPGQPSLQILLRATCPGEATVIWTLERHSD